MTTARPVDAGRLRERRQGLRLICRGRVQGVGFRPAVARLAAELGLEGRLMNVSGAVRLELAGPRAELERFLARLPSALPVAARLETLQPTWLAPPLPPSLAAVAGLRIETAAARPLRIGLVAPSLMADRAPCQTCRLELRDPRNRRFRDPFISCCSCGPRYSIATAEPFSRAHTTLAAFQPCPACQAEFHDPSDRRFHAETIGCPACGPMLRLLDAGGRPLAGALPGPGSGGWGRPRDTGGNGSLAHPECWAASSWLDAGRSAATDEPGSTADPHATADRPSTDTAGDPAAPAGPADPIRPTRPTLAADPGSSAAALEAAVTLLRSGRILALQGVGGFQLLVDARDPGAVARLRTRKRRPDKPFALLVDRLERLAELVHPSPEERAALEDPAAPIVLLPCPDDAHETVLAGVAPGAHGLGVMLPASPLHLLLAEAFAGPLVATSGNRSGEPLCLDPPEAIDRLSGIADAFLVHDRPIARPLDDSVLQLIDGRPALLRRARGHAPEGLTLGSGQAAVGSPAQASAPRQGGDPRAQRRSPAGEGRPPATPAAAWPEAHGTWLLGLGSDLKSAPALAIGDQLWISPHLGDLADHRCLERWRGGIAELLERQRRQPPVVAMDGHPQFLSTQLAGSLPPADHAMRRSPHPVAHHRAHGLAVVAEHDLRLPMAALVLDGLGHGDGDHGVPLWGCEFLWLEPDGARRLASLRPFPLPGGERAVREPRRSALGLLWAAELLEHPGATVVRRAFESQDLQLLLQAMRTGCQSPWCSSAGRLFDAVAALLDLVQHASHEAHAGLLLQGAAARAPACPGAYPLPLLMRTYASLSPAPPGAKNDDPLPRLDWHPLLTALLADIAAGCPVGSCAARFHMGLIEGLADALTDLSGATAGGAGASGMTTGKPWPMVAGSDPPQADVILAGGCFQNRLLLEGLITALRRRGFRPHWAERLPGNDGGLAAGQILALRQATAGT